MDPLLAYARAHRGPVIRLIRKLVECESPTGDAAGLGRMAELVAAEVAGVAKTRKFKAGQLLCEFRFSGKRPEGRILALGHMDTVWPVGTLARMPFRQRGGRLWGPGVLDMKSGIAFFLFAMRALKELEMPIRRRVALLLTTDEETGSSASRALVEREARRSTAVLVVEPGAGLDGKLKTARKGGGQYTVTVHGRAAHAGIDFAAGASAIVELAQQVSRIAGFTRLEKGITVNPGLISGGTGANVVASEARAVFDVRIARMADFRLVEGKFHRLKPFDPRCRLEISGGLKRPPMVRTPAIRRLFRTARALAAELGVELGEAATGGGSDGNFTAALGVPTLDGLGGVGEGAHAPGESILVDRIPDRIALLAKLVAVL